MVQKKSWKIPRQLKIGSGDPTQCRLWNPCGACLFCMGISIPAIHQLEDTLHEAKDSVLRFWSSRSKCVQMSKSQWPGPSCSQNKCHFIHFCAENKAKFCLQIHQQSSVSLRSTQPSVTFFDELLPPRGPSLMHSFNCKLSSDVISSQESG